MKIREILQSTPVLILDFDGTLVDSNQIKIGAFAETFSEYEDRLNEIMAYCSAFHHTPREEKFKHVCAEILKIPYTAGLREKFLKKYADHTTAQIIAAPEIPGSLLFLKRFSAEKKFCLLSSTPGDVLISILEARGMRGYFQTVRGAPVNKTDWLEPYAGKGIFFGDALEDAASAREAGVVFVGVANPQLKQEEYFINNFKELL